MKGNKLRKLGLIAGSVLTVAGALLLFVFPAGPVADVTITATSPQPDGEAQEAVFPAGNSGYLIVAPERLLALDAMKRFIDHKVQLGLRVKTAPVEEIEKSSGPGDLADKVRRFLKTTAKEGSLRFVLLVGDPDPADARIKLPVPEDLPHYMVSAPSRSLGGTHASDEYDTTIGTAGSGRLVVLTGPNLQVLRSGTLRYWYVNCASPGKIKLQVFRKKVDGFYSVYAGEMENIQQPGVAVRATRPVQLEAGDFVGFLLPAEGAVKVGAVRTPGIISASFEDSPLDTAGPLIWGSEDVFSRTVEAMPLVQCSVYFEPRDVIGSVPSKMCWPLGTYNGVYGALLRDICLSQCPTDAYFANVTSDWDANSNGFFGETFLKFFRYDGNAKPGELSTGDFVNGSDAFLPELLVGRIPFDDPETVTAIMEKTIAYETAQDTGWRRHCLLAADPLAPDTDSYALCELIRRNICKPAGFKTTRFYTEFDFDGEVQLPKRYDYEPEILVTLDEITADRMAAYERFSDAWRSGHPGFVLWSSHGNTDIARNIITLRDESDTNPLQAVTRRYVDALDDAYPAVVFATSCSALQQEPYYLGTRKKRTKLSHDWEPRPNLGRELLKNGAVAVVGHTRGAWFKYGWDSAEGGGCLSLAYDFTDRLLAGESVAGSLGAALRDYHTRWGSELTDGENLIGFIVYGDPSLTLGTGNKPGRPLLRRKRPPELAVNTPLEEGEGVEIRAVREGEVELEAGITCEINAVRAGADGIEEWFSLNGFTASDRRFTGGKWSYYSGTARHMPATLTLNMPLLGGQDLTASFNCWYNTEPGLDYVVFEKSSDGISWEPLDVYSGSSNDSPLFHAHHPRWRQKRIEFATGYTPTYLRMRYVTNDSYRKDPHEGFYMDNFALRAKTGKVRYISGWQRIKLAPEHSLLAGRPGSDYLRARVREAPAGGDGVGSFFVLTTSEYRDRSWAERLRTPTGAAGAACGLLGLFFLLAAAVTPGKRPS